VKKMVGVSEFSEHFSVTSCDLFNHFGIKNSGPVARLSNLALDASEQGADAEVGLNNYT